MVFESTPVPEKTSHLLFDTYSEYIAQFNVYNGRSYNDDTHLFLAWFIDQTPDLQAIDGVVRLDDLYEVNVIENGMAVADFYNYCYVNQLLPSPNSESFDQLFQKFKIFISDRTQQQQTEYEAWAATNGISVAPGSVTRFLDSDGYTYRVKTDFINRGEIIDSSLPGDSAD